MCRTVNEPDTPPLCPTGPSDVKSCEIPFPGRSQGVRPIKAQPPLETPRSEKRDRTEVKFLHGPQSRRFELARAWRIFIECMSGFRHLHFVGPCVTVYG